MKKYILFIFAVILISCSSSCKFNQTLPDTVMIGNEEYRKLFLGELYPIDTNFQNAEDTEDIRICGKQYYKYLQTELDCYIAYDNNAEPNIYFETNQFKDAVSYYKNAENFKFFCLLGNIHDDNDQRILEIKEIDASKLDQLLDFSKANDYNPFTSFNNEDGLTTVPIANPNDWLADEIHFYKESKDGAFSTSGSYTFKRYENKLCLVYQYDFTDEKSPVMLIRYVPTEISNYFCSLLANLLNE